MLSRQVLAQDARNLGRADHTTGKTAQTAAVSGVKGWSTRPLVDKTDKKPRRASVPIIPTGRKRQEKQKFRII